MTQNCPGGAKSRDVRRTSAMNRLESTVKDWERAAKTRKDEDGPDGRKFALDKAAKALSALENTQANMGRGSHSLKSGKTEETPSLADVGL